MLKVRSYYSTLVTTMLITQLNKYQRYLYLLEFSHQMTNVCLLISEDLPRFAKICNNGNIKLFCTSKQKQLCVPMLQMFSNLGKFSEINKQFHVKSWLTYWSYNAVWWILSCNTPQLEVRFRCYRLFMKEKFNALGEKLIFCNISLAYSSQLYNTLTSSIEQTAPAVLNL